jgi:hypothetical protein
LDYFDSLSDYKFFLFFGKNSKWKNENFPDLVIDCVRRDLDAWIDMMGVIRIGKSDVCLVIPRNQWQYETVYTEYDDTVNLTNPYNPKQFYVTTSENKVYKCISNNNGSPSTIQPTAIGTNIFCTSDGYRWKFMYQISDDLYNKFATDTKIPVEFIKDGFDISPNINNSRSLQLAVQKSAINGSINHVVLSSLGDSFLYTNQNNNNTVVKPGRVGDTKIYVNLVSFNLSDRNELAGYSIYFNQGLGSGEIYEIESVTGTDEGEGNLELTLHEPLVRPISSVVENKTHFDILPTAKVVGDGIGCQLLCKMVEITGTDCNRNYQIDNIEILKSGKNYTNAKIIIGPVNAMAPVARAIISPQGGHGSNSVKELGASEIMIFCSSRAGIAGDLPTINNFRQFGLILNPKIGRGINSGQIAGIEGIEGYKLRIVKPKTILVKIKFKSDNPPPNDEGDTDNAHIYIPSTGDYVPGQLVKQFSDSSPIGRVVRWIPPIAVSSENCCTAITGPNPTGYLYIEPLQDSVFLNDSLYPIEGYTDAKQNIGPSYKFFEKENNFVPVLGYSSESFDSGKFIIGINSLTTARIIGWETGVDGTDGYLILGQINGKFLGPTIDNQGNFVEGERIIQVSSVNPFSGIWDGSNISSTGVKETNIGIVAGNIQKEILTRESYSQTYKLTATNLDDSLIDSQSKVSYLSLDSTIDILESTHGLDDTSNVIYRKIGTASVVSYKINTSEEKETVYLELTSVRGWDRSFVPFATETEPGILLGFGTKEDDNTPVFRMKLETIVKPDLQINSGEIIYIDNIKAITRNPERLEEFKLILRF